MLAGFLILAFAGCGKDAGPTGRENPEATGAVPDVALTLAFDDAPLEGYVEIRPPAGSADWGYAVDLNDDGVWDHEGRVARDLGFAFRFDSPGIHQVRVRLEGPDGPLEVDRLAIVNDPTAVQILALGQAPILGQMTYFEGIAVAPDGGSVYVGDFGNGAILRLDADGLSVRDSVLLDYGVEGLSISPSGDYLFAGAKYPIPAYRFTLPGIEPASPEGDWANRRYYVHALNDREAIYSGHPASIRDVAAGVEIRRALRSDGTEFPSMHFDVSPDGRRAAFVDNANRSGVSLYTLPGLEPEREILLSEDRSFQQVAFDATGQRLFAIVRDILGNEIAGGRLMVLDLETGDVVRDLKIEELVCSSFCVANAVSLSRDGRYLAFETGTGVLIVETMRGIPLYRLNGQGSVARDPASGAGFYLLSVGGGIRRIEVVP